MFITLGLKLNERTVLNMLKRFALVFENLFWCYLSFLCPVRNPASVSAVYQLKQNTIYDIACHLV